MHVQRLLTLSALAAALGCAACTTPEHEAGLAWERAGWVRAQAAYNDQRAACAGLKPDGRDACEFQAQSDLARARADASVGVSHYLLIDGRL